MQRFEHEYSLPRQLVGDLREEQVSELFDSGWRFNPGDQLWVKVFYAADGAPETPVFLAHLIQELQAQNIMVAGPFPGAGTAVSPAAEPAAGFAAPAPASSVPKLSAALAARAAPAADATEEAAAPAAATADAAPQTAQTAQAATVPNVQARLERMDLGQAGAVPPMSSLQMNVGEAAMPARLFSHEVGVIFVADGALVQTDQLAAMGLNDESLLDASIANLAGLVPSLNMVRPQAGVVMVTGLGGLEACMALVPQLWDEVLAAEFPNGPVIAIPSKDVLVACDRLDTEGLDGIRRGNTAMLQQKPDALLAKGLYERRDGNWVVLDPDASGTQGVPEPTPVGPAGRKPDPTMTIQEAGMEGLVISDSDPELGGGQRTEAQMDLLFKAGFRFDADTQEWSKVFVGEQESPFMPWRTPEWEAASGPTTKKRGRFGRRK